MGEGRGLNTLVTYELSIQGWCVPFIPYRCCLICMVVIHQFAQQSEPDAHYKCGAVFV